MIHEQNFLNASIRKLKSSFPNAPPHLPGIKANFLVGKSMQSQTNALNSFPVQIIGQNGAEYHKGIIRIPEALQLNIWRSTREIRHTGEHT